MKLSYLSRMKNMMQLFSLPSEKFENKVKLDRPPPIQENDQYLYILDSVADGTICFY